MEIWFVRFMLTLAFTEQAWSLPLACSYNGTTYKEGETIKTDEPCLSCTCRRGSLICNLRVCAEPPETPSPGCYVVHKANDCCPQVLCEEKYKDNGVELRTAFKSTDSLSKNDCLKNGSLYAEGSAVGSSEKCEYCYCIRGEIRCVKPHCSFPFDGCKPIYHESSCCPTHYDCRMAETSISTTPQENSGCEKEGIFYPEGEKVPSPKCEMCFCMKGVIECGPITCPTEVNFENCQPLHAGGQCCPTGFDCEQSNSTLVNSSMRIESNVKKEKGSEKANCDQKYTTESITKITVTDNPELEDATKEITSLAPEDSLEQSTEMNLSTDFNLNNKTTDFFDENTTLPETTTMALEVSSSDNENKTSEVYSIEEKTKNKILEEIVRNSSSTTDDYNDYDYSEPKLPPSLPNLVIFPFVAADAVDKDDDEDKVASNGFNGNKPNYFYKDSFNPPEKTEGGFIPKDPLLVPEPYYEFIRKHHIESKGNLVPESSIYLPFKNEGSCFVDGKEIPHGQFIPKNAECLNCGCSHGEIICQEIVCPAVTPGCIMTPLKDSCCGEIVCESTFSMSPLTTESLNLIGNDNLNNTNDLIKDETKIVQPDLSESSDVPPLYLTSQTTKPVTVTYKNIIVDYYPEYRVTVTRDDLKTSTELNSVTESTFKTALLPPVIPSTLPNDYIYKKETEQPFSSTTSTSFSNPVTSKDLMLMGITTEKQITSSLETAVPFTTTESFFFGEFLKSFFGEDLDPTTVATVYTKISTELTSLKGSTMNITQINNQKGTTFEGAKLTTSMFQDTFTTTEKVSETETKEEDENLSQSESSNSVKGNFGILLKLAGCNIYGRMYRVGKIIAELSGPCLKCVCTESGVECSPLDC